MNTNSPERTQYAYSGVTRPCMTAARVPPTPASIAEIT
ncbi:hypothetical protein KBTX_02799 [wastewater metagenome]|uniref:Uncharacterized protein n=2 Tax=unclassified sequences TaxID=12908 RepID=A0A5B8RCC5_9ZZZZ|nr:hypothetical protein KBTEX_02799 [uncultured organism]